MAAATTPSTSATESNFRQGLSGFAWARPGAVIDDSANSTAPTNFFTRWTSSISGAIPVRSGERTNEEEAYFALSRWERFSGFLLCTAGAALCFFIAFFIGLPLLALKPRKFAVSFQTAEFLSSLSASTYSPNAVPILHLQVSFSLGSASPTILFMVGFAILQGPLAHLKHICNAERLPFTGAYFGSLFLTLYFAIGRQAYLPTLILAIVQCAALVSYFVAYFPGGMQTLQFGSRMALRGAGSLLPV
ncbi:BZ3500_MvSof-1268-A1-R1_Chr12-3g04013 [Microbotryum saponariae]|uniref:Protein transport protein SFT2 n=1 Tax=Microbotryum saponariae TaxID=289078 RepID=A0A2X0KNZ7_9BASI|nr:BZ3500_MvSof-1268-A1-R1_Chr12-3g04013 [Microbotryum saponariae]SDA02539.1 BZ3501_MvSof-1269-A2-R1_Chr12-3g03668 [Microbotryum saponariae]